MSLVQNDTGERMAAEREGFYEKTWKDFVSLQRGDAKQICVEAARYRWLKENRDVMLLTSFFGNGCINRTIEEVDAAIDDAMTANVEVSGLRGFLRRSARLPGWGAGLAMT